MKLVAKLHVPLTAGIGQTHFKKPAVLKKHGTVRLSESSTGPGAATQSRQDGTPELIFLLVYQYFSSLNLRFSLLIVAVLKRHGTVRLSESSTGPGVATQSRQDGTPEFIFLLVYQYFSSLNLRFSLLIVDSFISFSGYHQITQITDFPISYFRYDKQVIIIEPSVLTINWMASCRALTSGSFNVQPYQHSFSRHGNQSAMPHQDREQRECPNQVTTRRDVSSTNF
ncbi:hypothetical protein EGW08_003877 [Elysia chlorotica]|uniref:Uncharacterized protein n=1 Tax=Elysia chlorotica TaxID=188477 RepID=A0A3S1BHF3_ELYCH|nr:hypothetical protein EGW08_003877 [Elysia chlorotica]